MRSTEIRSTASAAVLLLASSFLSVNAEERVIRISDDDDTSSGSEVINEAAAPDFSAFLNSVLSLDDSDDIPVAVGSIPLSTPADSAFTALGISPNEVNRPSSTQTLAVDIFGALEDEDGAGFSVSFAPYILMGANDVTLHDYRQSYQKRALSRVQVSAALAAQEMSAGDGSDTTNPMNTGAEAQSTPVRASIGVRWTIFDRGDPRMDDEFSKCLLEIDVFPTTDELLEMLDNSETGDITTEVEKAIQKKLDSGEIQAIENNCRKNASKRLWNNSAWDVAVAPTFNADSGNASDLSYSGLYASTSISYGFEGIKALKDSAQLIANITYRENEPYTPEMNNSGMAAMPLTGIERDTLSIGARAVFGDPEQYFASLEIAHEDRSFSNVPMGIDLTDDSGVRYAFGAEYKISDNLWISVSTGASSSDLEDDELFSLARLKWTFGNKGSFAETVQDAIGGVVASRN